jgi:tRNA(Ile)-lysidine synthase
VTYIVAVSGGVDSVVLLDMLVAGKFGKHELVVAHFDHGIRDESGDDATFVRQLAADYGLPFETKREELGVSASEELARGRRYAFLREVATKHSAKIMTAHHADDVVETIAINLTRGTGWRGLAVLDSPDIERPLLAQTKAELIEYAKQHDLEWREDVTNNDTKYLRNDLRQRLGSLDAQTKETLTLYRNRQVALRREVETEAGGLVGESPYSRYLFINTPDIAAEELLRKVVLREVEYYATRPQLSRALLAIKTLHAGRDYELAAGVTLRFTGTSFIVERQR